MRKLRVEIGRFGNEQTKLQLTWDAPPRDLVATGDGIIAAHETLPYESVEVVAFGLGAALADYLERKGLPVREVLPEPRSMLTGYQIKAQAAGEVQSIDIGDQRLSAPALLTWLLTLDEDGLLRLFRGLHELKNRGEL